MKFTIFTAITIGAFTENTQASANQSEMKVAVLSGVVVRLEPSAKSKAITTLAFAEKVTVIQKGNQNETILALTGTWFHITAGKKAGWIFAPLLKDIDAKHVIVIEKGVAVKKDLSGIALAKALSQHSRLILEPEFHDPPVNGLDCSGKFLLMPGGAAGHETGGSDIVCATMTAERRFTLASWRWVGEEIQLSYKSVLVDHCHSEACEKKSDAEMSSPAETGKKAVKPGKLTGDDKFEIAFP